MSISIYDMARRTRLNVGTKAVSVEIVSEPYLLATRFGYAPIVDVRVIGGIEASLLISSQSVTAALESLRVRNSGVLTGIRMAIRKESEDSRSKYIVTDVT